MDAQTIVSQRDAINKLVGKNAEKLVLMHWFDVDEHREVSQFGGGIKNKFPVEVQYFAVGILTGEPIFDKPWGVRHTKWILPTTGLKKTQVTIGELEWQSADEYPQSMGGTYPSLDQAEPTGYIPLGESKYRLARATQIIVGEDAIRTWLMQHKEFGKYAERWFAQIVNHAQLEMTG